MTEGLTRLKLSTKLVTIYPTQAVHEACDHFLGKAYKPELVQLEENLYIKGSKLIQARKQKRISQGLQLELPLWHEGQAG